MQIRQRRKGVLSTHTALLLGVGVMLTALGSVGCGSSGSDPTARLRGIDLSPNAGTAGVLANSYALGGDLNFGQGSSYLYAGQGVSTFGFTTSTSVPSGVTITYPASPTLQLNNNLFYTAYLIGLAAVPDASLGKPDPRLIQTVVTGDRGAAAGYTAAAPYSDPPSGQANVRILNGAPDAGTVDVLINGKAAFTGVSYPAFPTRVATTDTTAPATTPVTLYQAVPSGTLSVQVNATGTLKALVPATNVSVSSGQAYTIVVTEPTTTPDLWAVHRKRLERRIQEEGRTKG